MEAPNSPGGPSGRGPSRTGTIPRERSPVVRITDPSGASPEKSEEDPISQYTIVLTHMGPEYHGAVLGRSARLHDGNLSYLEDRVSMFRVSSSAVYAGGYLNALYENEIGDEDPFEGIQSETNIGGLYKGEMDGMAIFIPRIDDIFYATFLHKGGDKKYVVAATARTSSFPYRLLTIDELSGLVKSFYDFGQGRKDDDQLTNELASFVKEIGISLGARPEEFIPIPSDLPEVLKDYERIE